MLQRLKPLVMLGVVYLAWRVLFYTWPALKTDFFIQPAGTLVALFWGNGFFDGSAWVYYAGDLQVLFNAQCSGTTFFALLSAYTAMQYSGKIDKSSPPPLLQQEEKSMQTDGLSLWWLAACYPITLCANAARVLCSVYVYAYAGPYFSATVHAHIHLLTGVTVFSFTLIALTLFWARKHVEAYFEHSS